MNSFIPTEFYIVLTDFPRLGFSSAGDPVEDMDAAADQMVGMRNEGCPATVLRISRDGMHFEAEDVTDLACRRVQQWLYERNDFLPDWLADELAHAPGVAAE